MIGKATILARQSSQDPTQLDEEKFNAAIKLLTKACELDPRSEQAKIGLAQLKLQNLQTILWPRQFFPFVILVVLT
ncbi:hypothetical protein R0J91_20535, partial [Micrococcus sp. SIMBA_131]